MDESSRRIWGVIYVIFYDDEIPSLMSIYILQHGDEQTAHELGILLCLDSGEVILKSYSMK